MLCSRVADVRFSHEYVTPMAASLFTQALGQRREE